MSSVASAQDPVLTAAYNENAGEVITVGSQEATVSARKTLQSLMQIEICLSDLLHSKFPGRINSFRAERVINFCSVGFFGMEEDTSWLEKLSRST